jgi:hypothetical protein
MATVTGGSITGPVGRPATECSCDTLAYRGATHHEYFLRNAMRKLQDNNDVGTDHTGTGL